MKSALPNRNTTSACPSGTGSSAGPAHRKCARRCQKSPASSGCRRVRGERRTVLIARRIARKTDRHPQVPLQQKLGRFRAADESLERVVVEHRWRHEASMPRRTLRPIAEMKADPVSREIRGQGKPWRQFDHNCGKGRNITAVERAGRVRLPCSAGRRHRVPRRPSNTCRADPWERRSPRPCHRASGISAW